MSSKAYKIILKCLYSNEESFGRKSSYVRNLQEALSFFSLSLNRHVNMGKDIYNILEKEFDLDNIVNFSDAWTYWHNMYDVLFGRKKAKAALDQLLFSGKHVNSENYFRGIEFLARKNAKQTTEALLHILPPNKHRKMADLGAGPGVYSKAFIKAGLARESRCLDLPYVVEEHKLSKERAISWQAVDLLEYTPFSDERYDLIFLANVLHHYDPKKITQILQNISSVLGKESFLVIQDYLLWPKPAFSPIYASALGVHFALTTEGGRCYTGAEILSLVQKNLGSMKFYSWINIHESDLIVFKNV